MCRFSSLWVFFTRMPKPPPVVPLTTTFRHGLVWCVSSKQRSGAGQPHPPAFPFLSRCHPNGHTVGSWEVTTGNFSLDHLTEIGDVDTAGFLQRWTDGALRTGVEDTRVCQICVRHMQKSFQNICAGLHSLQRTDKVETSAKVWKRLSAVSHLFDFKELEKETAQPFWVCQLQQIPVDVTKQTRGTENKLAKPCKGITDRKGKGP